MSLVFATLNFLCISDYNHVNLENDISLLQLSFPLTLSTAVAPISLPAPGESLTGINETSCVISGWGATMGKIKVSVTSNRILRNNIQNQWHHEKVTCVYFCCLFR